VKTDRLLVLGLMGRYPLAGVGWQAVHYLVGLERLGWEVFYAEDSGAPPYSPGRIALGSDAEENVAFVRDVMASIGLADRWVYWDVLEDRHHGLGRDALEELYATSAQIWNLCGATRPRAEHRRGGVLVYVQTDPGVEQAAAAAGDMDVAAMLEAHDVLFTYAERFGRPDCLVPVDRRRWLTTRPPVVLDFWESPPPRSGSPFTTVGTWENRGKDVVHAGALWRWSKHASFLDLIDVPARAGVRAEAALAPPDDVAARFRASGWSLRDPREVSASLEAYRDFVRSSCGELTATKEIYVRSRSGWFSDRSACYLAAGRPVVTADTGLGDVLPCGRGLLAYRTPDEAVAALEAVRDDLPAHARAARALAEEHFDALRVLGAMLERIR